MLENQKRLNIIATGHPAVNELIGTEPIPEDMKSDRVWDQVRQWFTNCSPHVPGHSKCHEGVREATSVTPSRLVDVMAGEGRDQIRLTVSPKEREPLPYITLSYSWGGVDQDKLHLLRKDTLKAYQERIPDEHLPVLFKDAIDVVRRLNFRYIWIDAYCIIQQDPDDFQIEAARMGEIYRHAALNIAAGGAQNINSQLIGHRDPTLVNICQIRLDWENLAVQVGRSSDKPNWSVGSYFVFGANYIQGEILETPLNRRAWVLQEQQLSPRILHFGKNQVFWRCWGELGEMPQACEAFPKGTPVAPGFQRAHQFGLQTVLPENVRQTMGLDMHQQWDQLVMAYARCNITLETDRLVAISGLAASFAKVLNQDNSDYAAGLWRCGLPLSLCWQVDVFPLTWGEPPSRYKKFVAPSWSWASVKSYIRFPDPVGIKALLEQGFEVKCLCSDDFEITMEHVSRENPYGQVKSGQISFSGCVVPGTKLTWVWNPRKDETRGPTRNVALCFAPFPVALLCTFDDMDDYETRKRRGFGWPFIFKTQGIELIPLYDLDNPTDPTKSLLNGLVVVRERQGANIFSRIGTFRSFNGVHKFHTGSTTLNLYHAMEICDEIILI